MDQLLAQLPLNLVFLLAMLSIGGLVLLSDQLVESGIGLAKRLSINPLVIGTLVIGIGTSLDELVVNVNSLSSPNSPEIIMGNIVGSVVANFTLGLGLPALIATIAMPSKTIKKELLIFAGLLTLLNIFAADNHLSPNEGRIFIVATILMLVVMYQHTHQNPKRTAAIAQRVHRHQPKNIVKSAMIIVASLAGLLMSAKLLVHSSLTIAETMHINSYIVSILIVGLGTSLPEILASLQGILKKSPEIVLGNVMGSNIFIFCISMGVPMAFKSIPLTPQILADIRILNVLTIGATIFLFAIPKSPRYQKIISLIGGSTLLISFLLFVIQKARLF